ncbi:MAG: hypothetical protein KF774_05490 [Planctomyces sp.]|nr:hypothetical protein [Planctomyces sp.]
MPATEQIWRPLSSMHRVFACSAVALLAATLLMMAKDERRDWRRHQSRADELRIEKLERELDEMSSAEFLAEEADRKARLEQAEAALQAPETQERLRTLDRRRADLQGQVDVLSRDAKFKNAERDVARANLDLHVRDQVDDAQLRSSLATFNAESQIAQERAQKLQQVQAELRDVQNELAEIYAARDEAQKDLNRLYGERRRVEEQLAFLSPNSPKLPEGSRSRFAALKRSFKEWPIINGFNPHHKIEYDWPRDLEIQLGMARVERVDRCRTCHYNINDFGAGNVPAFPADDVPQPYSAHPHPDLYLTSTSPHPIESFGCTICHEGDGSGTSFQNAEHSPRDPSQAAQWDRDHHWHSNHFWEYPMYPSHLVESSCLRCHHNVVELGVNRKFGASAPKVYEGYELIRNYGCFGCHEINGYDGTRPIGPDMRLEPQTPEEAAAIAADPNAVPGNLRKVGPSLRHISSKVTPEFISYWTEDPQRFRPSTKMPKFFNLDNQHDALAGVLQPVELAGISAYLMAKSQPMQELAPPTGYEPDAGRGKIAFERRGCLACHSHDDPEFAGVDADFGPNITNIHEKVKPGPEGFAWLYTWLKNPELYHTKTRMPNLFLNAETVGGEVVDPAADIAAYLLQGGPKEFPAPTLGGPSLGLVLDADFTAEEARQLRARHAGVRVEEVLPTGPASRALAVDVDGRPLKNSRGQELSVAERLAPIRMDDVILEFNGTAVGSREQLAQLTREAGNGARAVLKLFSGGLERMVELWISTPLEDLTRLHLSKSPLGSAAAVQKALDDRRYPVPPSALKPGPDGEHIDVRDLIKGDEVELVATSADEEVSEAEWVERQLQYVGRRTISQYGCYACHDIPGFETAKPIGTALQDWGRKDTSKLAPEHIAEFLHHHGEPDGSSTHARISEIVRRGARGGELTDEDRSAAYFYNSLEHHGRDGFIWQKLRAPRSYDYKKIEAKGWDERLRMPKFPFDERQIEAVATFVLGLVNDPPPPAYQYRPTGAERDIIHGERLLEKYNCTGCHLLEMPSLTYKASLGSAIGATRDELVKWFVDNGRRIDSGEISQDDIAGRGDDALIQPEAMQEPLRTFMTNCELTLKGRLDPSLDLQSELAKLFASLARSNRGDALRKWFAEHPESMLSDVFSPADHPEALRLLLKLKPAVSGLSPHAADDGRALITAHGLVTNTPDPEEEDPEFREYGMDVWETLDIAGRIRLPSAKVTLTEADLVSQSNGRGGELALWLTPRLVDELGDINKSWQAAPPPLYKEGIKVQTPWLFRFLKNPEQLRYTTVLRMPRFNMTDEEAQILANYFAAIDGVDYPYQSITVQEPDYVSLVDQMFREAHPELEERYEGHAWKVLNGPLCVKCHQVGGHPYQASDPRTDIRGPNLDRVEKRLQNDWTRTWIYRPTWITPYTSMPVNFPADKPPFSELFGANSAAQVEAVVYSLMNYSRMLEGLGVITYTPPAGDLPPEGEATDGAPAATEASTGAPAAADPDGV